MPHCHGDRKIFWQIRLTIAFVDDFDIGASRHAAQKFCSQRELEAFAVRDGELND